MKCPNCNHVSETALLQCSQCGEAYDRHTLEEYQHIEYLLTWLAEQDAALGAATIRRLQESAEQNLKALQADLFPLGVPALKPEPPALEPADLRALALLHGLREAIPGWILSEAVEIGTSLQLRDQAQAEMHQLGFEPDGRDALPELPQVPQEELETFILKKLADWEGQQVLSRSEHLKIEALIIPPTVSGEQLRSAALLQAVAERLEQWTSEGIVGTGEAAMLKEDLAKRLADLGVPAGVEMPHVTSVTVNRYTTELADQWEDDYLLSETAAFMLREFLAGKRVSVTPKAAPPEPVLAATPTTADVVVQEPVQPAPAPTPPPAPPKAPPKPRQPLFQWDKLWEKVVEAAVSGLLVRWLRYFAAFLFVISIAIVVLNFWAQIPQWGQVAIIFFVPSAFYGGGLLVRKRLQLVQTGSVLVGIGQILLAVDFAAIYQFGGLTVDLALYWLATSALCTLLYLFTAWRLAQEEFFGYIALSGLGSTFAALALVLTHTVEWPLMTLTVLGLLSMEAAHRLGRSAEIWGDIAASARRFPQIFIPPALLFLIFVPGVRISLALPLAFLIAGATAALLAWRFPHLAYTHVAVWFSAVVVGVVLWSLQVPWPWFASAAAGISPVYAGLYKWLSKRLSDELPSRRIHLWAFWLAGFGSLLLSLGLGLLAVPTDLWAGVAALSLSAVVLGGYAALLEISWLVLAAAGLFVLPLSFAVGRWASASPLLPDWLMASWSGLGLVYFGAATALWWKPRYGRWLTLAAAGLSLPVLLVLGVNHLMLGQEEKFPALVALAGLLTLFTLADLLHLRTRFPALSGWLDIPVLPEKIRPTVFQYPIGLLIPLILAFGWGGLPLAPAWIAVGFAVLSLAYVLIGAWLGRKDRTQRFPFHFYAYPLGLIAGLVGLSDQAATMTAMYILVSVLALLAFIYRRPFETAAAGVLLLWPFHLTLNLVQVQPHANSLAHILLAGLGFIPLGIWLKRQVPDQQHHIPLWVTGYAVSLFALAASLLGRYGGYPTELPWVGILVPVLATVLYAASAYLVRGEFVWAAAAVLPLAFWQILTALGVPAAWQAVAWVGLGAAYLLLTLTPLQTKHAAGVSWKWPLTLGAWALAAWGMFLSAPLSLQAMANGLTNLDGPQVLLAPAAAQFAASAFVILAALRFRSRWPLFLQPWLLFVPVTLLFIGYGESTFGRVLLGTEYGIVWAALGALLVLAAVGFDQSGVVRKERSSFMHGIYLGGYIMVGLAVFWALGDQASTLWAMGLWVLVTAASAVVVHFGRLVAWDQTLALLPWKSGGISARVLRSSFIWLSAWTFPIWMTVLLNSFQLVEGFQWLGLVGSGAALLVLAIRLRRVEPAYTWPLHLSGQTAVLVSLGVSAPLTLQFLAGVADLPADRLPGLAFILVQWLAVAFYATSAWEFRRGLLGYAFPYLAAGLSFFPYTLGWITFSTDVIGRSLTQPEFGVAWTALAAALLGVALLLDQRRVEAAENPASAANDPASKIAFDWRKFSAHGPYLVGYVLAGFALVWNFAQWTQESQPALLWTFGLWLALIAGSGLLVHAGRHATWGDLRGALFGGSQHILRDLFNGLFIWLAAWSFPVWLLILVWEFGALTEYGFLAYVASALVYLVLALRLKRLDRTYAWPFVSAGQFFALLALIQTTGFSAELLAWTRQGRLSATESTVLLGLVLIQVFGAIYYAASSWYGRAWKWIARFFALAASGLALVAYSLSWIGFVYNFLNMRLAYPLLGFSGLVLLAAFGLDWIERRGGPDRQRVGYAHGPYLLGYLLSAYLVYWTRAYSVPNLYALGGVIVLAALSQLAVHFQRHKSWMDFVNLYFRRASEQVRDIGRTGFLWLAAYATPAWLSLLLAHNGVEWAWRGAALALAAPLYIALGLLLRRVDRAYTWPLYSAGYLLTAVGALVSTGDQVLSIYVLALNTVVYAVSAYIFRQPTWLYLSTALVPIISLMTLDYNLDALPARWVAGIFMITAYIYFAAGTWFGRYRRSPGAIGSFALPFYAPSYLLSAVALAVSSSERELAIVVYLAGVVLYAFSAWRFKESIFLYPAVWLAAVPYYLGMTYTALQPSWYGVGWLPLIVGAVLLGRFVFHRKSDLASASHPAMPFYSLAYALSLSMIFIARADMTALTVALALAAALYLASAWLFRRAWWLYPGLLAVHLALLAYFAIDSAGGRANLLPVAYLPLTFLLGLVGAQLWRRRAAAEQKPGLRDLSNEWAAPLLTFAILDIVIWQVVALAGLDTGIVVSGGHAILLGIVAVMWASPALVWGSLGFLALAIGLRLAWTGLPLAVITAIVAGIGFLLYLLGRMTEVLSEREGLPGREAFALWSAPLVRFGIGANTLGTLAALAFVFSNLGETALALAFSGALYLGIAYKGRYYRLGYAAVAMLELALVLLLLNWQVRQPQWFAVPAGLYFIGLAVFERRRGRGRFPLLLESLGLVVMLLTSFIQSLDPASGFWYFLILMAEGLAAMAWAAFQRRKAPFLIGLGANVVNILGQVVLVFIGGSGITRWVISIGVALILLLATMFAERWIIPRAQELRERLEAWE